MCLREVNSAQLRRLLPGRTQKSCFEGRFTERPLRAASSSRLVYSQSCGPIKHSRDFKNVFTCVFTS